jgi:putative hemolysin
VWVDLVLVAVLIGVNGLLAGSEMAFVSLRDAQVRRLSVSGGRAAHVAELAQDPNRYLGAVQLGITMAGFLASATAAVSISQPIAKFLGPLGPYARPAAIAAVTITLGLITLVFGELVPKRVAMQRAERWSLAAVRPLSLFITLTRPLIAALGSLTNGLVRAVGADPHQRNDEISDDEIVHLVETQPTLTESQRRIMIAAIEVSGRTLRQILVPRTKVVALDASLPATQALQTLRTAGYSRAPIINGVLDEPVGQAHVSDLVDASGSVGDYCNPILAVPQSLSVLEALRQLQASHTQLAIVVDEHGGTAGIITVEDLTEQLVGEIYDETDRDLIAVERDRAGALLLPGSFPIHDLSDIGIVLPKGSYVTVAGLILARLGRIPEVGVRTRVEGQDLEVVAMNRRTITTVRVSAALTPGHSL